ncbi:MAG: glycosidase, partial [Verrucomicrobiaceae bacterium]
MPTTQPPVQVHRLPHRITPDPSRMITRFFSASEEANRGRIERVLSLRDAEAKEILADLKSRYGVRHPDIEEIWMESFERVANLAPSTDPIDDERRVLIGAYFTMEYAVEAAALFNPSIVPAINQDGVPPGCTRFLMSLRATGEGHLSSIGFRVGVIDAENRITMEDTAPGIRALKPLPEAEFNTRLLRNALGDLGALGPFESVVLDKLGETFSIGELEQVLADLRSSAPSPAGFE